MNGVEVAMNGVEVAMNGVEVAMNGVKIVMKARRIKVSFCCAIALAWPCVLLGQSCAIGSPTSSQMIQTPQPLALTANVSAAPAAYKLIWSVDYQRWATGYLHDPHPAVNDYSDAWQGPFTVTWYSALNGDGVHTVSGVVYDIFGNALATCPAVTFTVRVEGMNNQSISPSFPTSGSTGSFGMLTFDGKFSSMSAIDGVLLNSNPGGACNSYPGVTSQTGGWIIHNFNTTCWPNGQHLVLAGYADNNISDPYLLSNTFTSSNVNGNNITLTNHYGVAGAVVTFATTGTLPSPLASGSQWYWKASASSSNTVTLSVSGGVMTFTTSSASGVTAGTPLYIRNIQSTNQVTGQPNCDGYFTAASGSGTSFTVTALAGCPNGASGAQNLEVDVNPYFVQYVDPNTIGVSATPGGSTVALTSGGSGTQTATFRIRSPYWTGDVNSGGVSASDYASTGGPANVYQLVTFSNGTAPMELRPPWWEMHLVAGAGAQSVCPKIENTDLTQSSPSGGCGGTSGLTYTEVNDGGLSGVCSVDTSGNVTPISAGWCQVQVKCASCAAGGVTLPTVTVYIQVHSGSVTFPHFTTCGVLATAFQTGSCHSFFPLGMWQLIPWLATNYVQASQQMMWLGPMMQQAHLNSALSGFGPGVGPGATPQSSCPNWSSPSAEMNATESFAQQWGVSLEFDMSQVWFEGNSGAAPITALAAILGNTQYNRQACVQSLVSHHVGTGVYWRYFHDDEFTDELGTVLEPSPIIGGASWTNAVASSGTITFNFSDISQLIAWSQSTGQGAWVQIVDAANTCLNGWYPINTVTNTGAYTTSATSTTTCSNGTYAPSGGTVTESTAQIVLNPSGLFSYNASQQNCAPLPSQVGASQQAWAATYFGGCGGTNLNQSTYYAASSALTSIVVSGSTATVNYAAHGISAGTAIRISGASSSNLNILAPVLTAGTNSFTIAYPGTTGQAAPASGTYNAGTDPNLFISVDPNWGPNPLGQFYALVNGVSNHPMKSWSILGSFFSPQSIPTILSYEYNSANTDSSFDYIPQGPGTIYGPDASVWQMANNSQSSSGLLTRAYQAKPRSMLWSSGFLGGFNVVQYCRSFTFNPACDRPAQLEWRPETLVAQLMGMKTLNVAALRAYNFAQNMTALYSNTCCGWQTAGTGTGAGMNPGNDPKQWAAMARVNALLTLREDTELQPEANKPYLGPMFSTDAHTSATYGNELTILCESEVPYGSFSQALPAISGGSVLKYILTGYSLTVTQLSGNPSTDTDEFCSSPGRTTVYVAQPPGVNVLNNITFAPPAPLPFGASKFLVQVGYYPNALQDDPVTDCTAVCTIAVDHHNTAAWYRAIYADSNNLPRSVGDPVQIPSQGLY